MMKIAQLTPGSGGNFYCENCLRDLSLVQALRKSGHDVLMIPMYLPLQSGGAAQVANAPIFFGGINVYLQQKMGFFRKTPRWLDKLFDAPGLLGLISKRSQMVDASELGETTLSMLQGENGRQVKELNRFVDWLCLDENKPDLICLSNILLLGLAGQIKQRLGVPVVCLLQDEDEFIDQLPLTYAKRAWELIRRRSEAVDVFVAVSSYFSHYMQQKLQVGPEKFNVVYMGIDPDKYSCQSSLPVQPTIGFLSRMCHGKGLDILVKAFIQLKREKQNEMLLLKVSGGQTGEDIQYVRQLQALLEKEGLLQSVEFVSEFDHERKVEFLKKLSVMCVPERRPPAYGLYVLESFAVGVPVVQPDIGVFPELISEQQGGFLYEPNTVESLAAKLQSLIHNTQQLSESGRSGRKTVEETFHINNTADRLEAVFKELLEMDC